MDSRRKQLGALPRPLTLEVERCADRAVLHLHGELDLHTAGELQEALAAQDEPSVAQVVVDLGDVTFLDSAVLGVLAGALQRARDRDGTVEIVCDNQRLLRLFRITSLDEVFAIHAELPGA